MLTSGAGSVGLSDISLGTFTLDSEGLRVEGVNDTPGPGAFSLPLGVLVYQQTINDYSNNSGYAIRCENWDSFGYKAGMIANAFCDLPDGQIGTLPANRADFKFILDHNKRSIPFLELYKEEIAAGLPRSSLEQVLNHLKTHEYSRALYCVVAAKDYPKIKSAIESHFDREYDCLVMEGGFVLVHPNVGMFRVPTMDEFCGARFQRPEYDDHYGGFFYCQFDESDDEDAGEDEEEGVEEGERGEAPRETRTSDSSKFTPEAFVSALASDDYSYIERHACSFPLEQYVTDTYVYAGTGKNKRTPLLLSRFKIGQVYKPSEILDLILKSDGATLNVPVWYHRIKGHFKAFGEKITFTNAKAIEFDKTGNAIL